MSYFHITPCTIHPTRRHWAGTASIHAPEDKSDIKFSALITGVATFARNAYKDVVKIGEVINKEEELDWTIVRVPLLNDHSNRDVIAGFIGDGNTQVRWRVCQAFSLSPRANSDSGLVPHSLSNSSHFRLYGLPTFNAW